MNVVVLRVGGLDEGRNGGTLETAASKRRRVIQRRYLDDLIWSLVFPNSGEGAT